MLQGARGLTQPAMPATAVVTAMGAKEAALSRLSADVVPPQQYRMPAGSATAIPVQTAPSVPSADPTPAEAQAKEREAAEQAAARKAQAAQSRAAIQAAAATLAATQAQPSTSDANAGQPPVHQPPPLPLPSGSAAPPVPPLPYRIPKNNNPTVHPVPTPEVRTSILLARQQWLGYLHHRLPPPPPIIWAWGIINPEMIDD